MESGDIMGREFIGEVVEVGKDNKALKVGDRVVVRAVNTTARPIPAHIVSLPRLLTDPLSVNIENDGKP